MSPTTLLLLATAAGLLALAWWWIGPIARAIAAEAGPSARRRPVPPGLADPDCGIGATLMAAAAQGGGGGGTAGGTATKPPTRKKPSGPDRRTFLRNTWLLGWAGVAAAFGASSIGFLWPNLRGGFGAQLDMGTPEDVAAEIDAGGGRFEFPAGRMYIIAYDESRDPDGQYADVTNGAPFMALYQKCVHLGCRVPWCDSSKWFECPCHGSRYNRWGEYQFGPAPRGLDRFPLEITEGRVMVNTGLIVTGPARSAGVLGEAPAGPHCN